MTRRTVFLLLWAAGAVALLLSSCASQPQEIPTGLSVEQIFQRAQDASDQNNYLLALRYYTLVATNYAADTAHVTWAAYEIAVLYHKMGNAHEALDRINALLDQYATNGDALPPAPKVLATKLKARWEEALKAAS